MYLQYSVKNVTIEKNELLRELVSIFNLVYQKKPILVKSMRGIFGHPVQQ